MISRSERIRQTATIRMHRIRMRRTYRTTFSTPEGKEVLRDLARFCGVDRDLFHEESDRITSYRLGQRRVLLRIMSWLNMSNTDIDALSRVAFDTDDESTEVKVEIA